MSWLEVWLSELEQGPSLPAPHALSPEHGGCLRTVPTVPATLVGPSHPGQGPGTLHSHLGQLMFCHQRDPAEERNGHSPSKLSLAVHDELNVLGSSCF